MDQRDDYEIKRNIKLKKKIKISESNLPYLRARDLFASDTDESARVKTQFVMCERERISERDYGAILYE